jgi:hypothetical protein
MKTIENLISMTPEDRRVFLWDNLSGPANRFKRQELMKELTSENIPLVKCGISHILEALAAVKPAKTEKPKGAEPFEGAHIIRKKCGRKGIIKANVNGKLEIQLEDGSIRKPAAHRFNSLYNFQNA